MITIILTVLVVMSMCMALHCTLECLTLGKKYNQLEDDLIDMKAKYLQVHEEMGKLERMFGFTGDEEYREGRYN